MVYSSSSFGSLCDGFYANIPSNKYWKHDQGYTSVVYAFVPFVNGQYRAWHIQSQMIVTGKVGANNVFIGKYAHNYKSHNGVSTSIGSGGVSFSTSSSNGSWQIASSVKY